MSVLTRGDNIVAGNQNRLRAISNKRMGIKAHIGGNHLSTRKRYSYKLGTPVSSTAADSTPNGIGDVIVNLSSATAQYIVSNVIATDETVRLIE